MTPSSPVRRFLAIASLGAGLCWVALVAWCWTRARIEVVEPTVQLRDVHGEFLGEVGEGSDERLGYWPLPEIPARVAAATVAIEDRRLYEHPGVDPVAVARAVRQNVAAGERVSGASTLAMQVARLQDPGPRTWSRKLTEALTALLLVDRHGTEAVLRQYLVLAPYGNNVHGIAYAARRYFDKPVEDLSWAETALLAAVPQAPGQMNLYTGKGRSRAVVRARRILDLLLEDGVITDVDHDAAYRELSHLIPPPRPVRPASTLHPVLALEARVQADRDAWRGQSVVTTTLDLALQGEVQGILRDAVVGWTDRGAGNAAAVVVDLQTGAVVADVGSVGWGDRARTGAIDFTRTPRYPGSTLKPFLYAHALDRGVLTPGTVLEDLARGPDGIGNADGRFQGPLLPRIALANSRNVPAVELARTVGLERTYGLFAELGLHDDRLPAEHYGLGVAIGGMPTTLLHLATAYTALATDGRLRPLRWTVDEPVADGRAIWTPEAARWAALALSDPMARLPSFPRMGHSEYPFGVAVKTGTSPDFRDAWAVAFSGRWLVAVWVGHPDWRPMQGLSGYRAGSSLAHAILMSIEEPRSDGFADLGLPPPEGWVGVEVCPLTGLRATPLCSGTFVEHFPPEQEPVADCTAHHLEGGRVVVDLPARFAAWQRQAGLPEPQRTLRPELPVRLSLLSPTDGVRVMRDPESPADQATLRLAVAVEPAVEEVVWYVDGVPYEVVGPPYEARWTVEPGAHTFEARLPYRPERSATASVFGGG